MHGCARVSGCTGGTCRVVVDLVHAVATDHEAQGHRLHEPGLQVSAACLYTQYTVHTAHSTQYTVHSVQHACAVASVCA
jgi:hypothetical protein